MATTVNNAFEIFMKDFVNLDSSKTTTARSSRDWLIRQIQGFSDFFPLYTEKDIHFGSFARRTKKRPLDDIDFMLCLHASGATWIETGTTVSINVPDTATPYLEFRDPYTKNLNSRLIINQLKNKLNQVPQYSKAEINRNCEAATLKLSSYDWNFDLVPCFITAPDFYTDKTFYLIPDGQGHWKKTDPRIDRDRTTRVNQEHGGNVLSVIRVMKYWNNRATMPSMPSYLLENMMGFGEQWNRKPT